MDAPRRAGSRYAMPLRLPLVADSPVRIDARRVHGFRRPSGMN
jgi:hypothetical protein